MGRDHAVMDSWGVDEAPLTEGWALPELTGHLATLEALQGWCWLDEDTDPALRAALDADVVHAGELPEVQALAAQGWRPLGEQPADQPLVTAWPREHRGWVRDRLPRVERAFPQPGTPWVYRQDPGEQDYTADFIDDLARDCGLETPPRGRFWLVRSPWSSLGVAVVLHLIVLRSTELAGPAAGARERLAGADLLAWDEQQVWAWWDQHPADSAYAAPRMLPAAQAWTATGAPGEEVADLVLAGLFPDDLTLLQADLDDGGAGLDRVQALAWVRLAGDPQRVVAWRRAGFAPDPPVERLGALFTDAEPDEVAEWLAAGFTMVETAQGLGLSSGPVPEYASRAGYSLAHALAWRDAGISIVERGWLQGADPTLCLAEAVAFDVLDIDPAARRAWVARGFSAAAARAWTDLEITPEEARVWRWHDLGSDDAAATRGEGPLPGPAMSTAWFAHGSGERHQRHYSVPDPPITRGIRALHNRRMLG